MIKTSGFISAITVIYILLMPLYLVYKIENYMHETVFVLHWLLWCGSCIIVAAIIRAQSDIRTILIIQWIIFSCIVIYYVPENPILDVRMYALGEGPQPKRYVFSVIAFAVYTVFGASVGQYLIERRNENPGNETN